jgi:hypothetical protein
MYVWIWRRLPGGVVGKLLGSLLLLAGAVAVLFLWVFPYAEPRLPFNQTTVEDGGGDPVTGPSG